MTFYTQSFRDLLVREGKGEEKHLLWITLERSTHSNAFSSEMIEDLILVLKKADWDRQIRVIIISGSGKSFCAGGDVKAMEQREGMFAGAPNELRLRYASGIQQIPLAMENMQTPIIAMINGPAIGAGLDFACMCDIRIASHKAKFGETFSKLSLVSGDGGAYFLQRVVGFTKAMEMSMTADVYSATDALKMNLINYLVDHEVLVEETKKLALKISTNAPIAITMMKKALKDASNRDLSSHLDMVAAFQGIVQRTEDHFEGIRALKDKDLPKFMGK